MPLTKTPPRYRTIADGLINAIVAKRYPLGSALPAEAELCVELQASRAVVMSLLCGVVYSTFITAMFYWVVGPPIH